MLIRRSAWLPAIRVVTPPSGDHVGLLGDALAQDERQARGLDLRQAASWADKESLPVPELALTRPMCLVTSWQSQAPLSARSCAPNALFSTSSADREPCLNDRAEARVQQAGECLWRMGGLLVTLAALRSGYSRLLPYRRAVERVVD